MPTCSTIASEKTHACLRPILHFSSIFTYALLENHFVPHSLFSNLQQLLPNLTPDWSFCIFLHRSDSHKRSFFHTYHTWTHSCTCAHVLHPFSTPLFLTLYIKSTTIASTFRIYPKSKPLNSVRDTSVYIYIYFVCTQDSSGVNYTLSCLEDYDFTEVIYTYTHIYNRNI